MSLRSILKASAHSDAMLRPAFAGGEERTADFMPVIQRGGDFARLGDPHFFAQVAVSKDGRYVEWPGEIDFSADALWLEGTPVATAISQHSSL